jgi:hypothetical protein
MSRRRAVNQTGINKAFGTTFHFPRRAIRRSVYSSIDFTDGTRERIADIVESLGY